MRKFSMILPAAAAAALAIGIAGASATEPPATKHGKCNTGQTGWDEQGLPIPVGGGTTTEYYQGYSGNVVSEDNLNPGVSSITTIAGSTTYQILYSGNADNTCWIVTGSTEASYEYDGPGNSPAEQNLCDRVDDCALGD